MTKAKGGAPSSQGLAGTRLRGSLRTKFKIIPESVWTPSVVRNPSLFQISDPFERFFKVNVSAKKGVIDMHYQTKASCTKVLDLVLPQYEGSGGVWVVTGTDIIAVATRPKVSSSWRAKVILKPTNMSSQ